MVSSRGANLVQLNWEPDPQQQQVAGAAYEVASREVQVDENGPQGGPFEIETMNPIMVSHACMNILCFSGPYWGIFIDD
jgi:hypothetical protein